MSNEEEEEMFSQLSDDLVFQILSKVPFRYLIILRCVSKLFLKVTNNPDFISLYKFQSKTNPNLVIDFLNHPNFISLYHHNTQSTTNLQFPPPPPPPPPPPVLPLVAAGHDHDLWQWRFYIFIKDDLSFVYNGKTHQLIQFRCPDDKLMVKSPCNGLVCLAGKYTVEIYNILVGVNYELTPPFSNESHWSWRRNLRDRYVFGFDPISKDYKIFCSLTWYKIKMFSLRMNSWSKEINVSRWELRRFRCFMDKSYPTVCINGFIYWQPSSEDPGILSFNLHKEEFVVIPHPPLPDGILPTTNTQQPFYLALRKFYSNLKLVSFGGCLCLAYLTRSSTQQKREGSSSSSSGSCEIQVELFILNKSGAGGNDKEEDSCSWNRERMVIPFSTAPEEVHIMFVHDQTFLQWFEAEHLRLYDLQTKCLFNLPLSPSL